MTQTFNNAITDDITKLIPKRPNFLKIGHKNID